MRIIESDERLLGAIEDGRIIDGEGDAVLDPEHMLTNSHTVIIPHTWPVAAKMLNEYARMLRAKCAARGGQIEHVCGYTQSPTILEAIRFFHNSGWFGGMFFMASGGRGIVRYWALECDELPAVAKHHRHYPGGR